MSASGNPTSFREERRLELHCQTEFQDTGNEFKASKDDVKPLGKQDVTVDEKLLANVDNQALRDQTHAALSKEDNTGSLQLGSENQRAVEILNITNTESLVKRTKGLPSLTERDELTEVVKVQGDNNEVEMSKGDQAVNLDIYRSIQRLEHKAENDNISKTKIHQENITITSQDMRYVQLMIMSNVLIITLFGFFFQSGKDCQRQENYCPVNHQWRQQ